jgi:phage-related protein
MHLIPVVIGRYAVYALASQRERCPLLDFLGDLAPNLQGDRDRMLALLARVGEHGPPRNTEVSHQVDDKIFEFIQGRLRVLWFYEEGMAVICTGGFIKKSQKTPRREKEQAKTLMQQYFESKADASLIIEKEEGV